MSEQTQQELNNAILYALRYGCLFPVPEPKPHASVREWTRWGALRHLHTAIAEHFRQDRAEAPQS